MTEEHYAPETTLYFESQKSFDDLTIQNKIKYHFEKHHFSNITFSADNIVGNLKSCTFRNCTFINFDGENISFENASFNNCRIINSNLKKCNFERVGMAYLQIINSDFTDANFAAAKIGDTRFDRNDLSGVKFHGATLDDVIITDTTVDKPIEGLYSENISMDGATLQELEASRNRIFSELKLEPLSFEQIAEQAKTSLEPLPETHLEKANGNLSFSNNQTIDDHTQLQFEIINKYNPAPNTYQTWIRNIDDVKSYDEALKDSDWEGWEQNGFDEIYTSQVVQDALDSGKITVYSSHPIEQGVFVTPSPMEAQSYSGDGNIYSKEVDLKAVAWIDPTQGQYANVEEYAAQMHSKQLNSETPVPEIQKNQPTLAEQKIAEVKEKLSNPQIPTKPLTNEEFDILKGEIVDIAKNYQADPKLAAELFAFKTQFYQYSLNNTLLIHLQNPHATFVASFTKWKSMGYSIKKDAKHMKISRPIEIAKFPREVNGKTKMIDVKNASAEEKAKIANGEIKVEKVTKFVPHQVFDISQTTCPPEDYPKIYSMGVPDIEKAQLYECIAEYAKDSGFSVTEEDMSSISLDGYYKPSDDSIHINSLLQDSKKLETMAHELAHGVLHKTTTQPTEIAEFEAESFGTMLQRKLGIPVTEDSKRYIKNYFDKSSSLTKAKFDMNDTLNRLSKAFKHVSTGIDNKIEEMGYGAPREQGRSLSQAKAQAVAPVKISSNFTQAL